MLVGQPLDAVVETVTSEGGRWLEPRGVMTEESLEARETPIQDKWSRKGGGGMVVDVWMMDDGIALHSGMGAWLHIGACTPVGSLSVVSHAMPGP